MTQTISSAPIGLLGHARQVYGYRELLLGLVRKELKVKYKNSTLGFIWSLLNPAMYLVVFYFVFQVFLGSPVPLFPIYLLSGLLVWNLFSGSLGGGAGSITGNHSLVNKVFFPREILPLASVGATLVHFFLQGLVLLGALLVFRQGVPWEFFWLTVPALVALLLLASALAILLSAINVYARDTQHLLELSLLAWFWMTPIVYHPALVTERLAANDLPTWLILLNPIVAITLCFQRGIYGVVSTETTIEGQLRGGGVQIEVHQILPAADQLWYLRNVAIVGAAALVLLAVALRVFDRLQGNFAEEL